MNIFNNDILKKENKSKRPLQVGKEIKFILSDIIAKGKIHDPLLFDKQIIISEVEVSSDLSHAKVFVMFFADTLDKDAMLKALNKNAGFFRSFVGKALHIKVIPILHFHVDTSIDKLQEVEELFNKIKPL